MNEDGTLWMGDIESWMSESFIIASFAKYGFRPRSVKLIQDKRINKSKNFCFVNFNSLKEANDALFQLNSKNIPNTNLFFKLNIAKNNPQKCKNAYVGNLPRYINDKELFNYFQSKYPSVYYASIIRDNGVSRGYGFIHFGNEEEYQKCLKEMDGTKLYNKVIKVKEKTDMDKKIDNDKYNNINNINYFPNINNNNIYLQFFAQQRKNEEKNYRTNKDETTSSRQKIDQDLSSFNQKDFQKTYTFKENIDLIKKDDLDALYRNIKKSVDKMVEHYQNLNKYNQISRIALYYSTNVYKV